MTSRRRQHMTQDEDNAWHKKETMCNVKKKIKQEEDNVQFTGVTEEQQWRTTMTMTNEECTMTTTTFSSQVWLMNDNEEQWQWIWFKKERKKNECA